VPLICGLRVKLTTPIEEYLKTFNLYIPKPNDEITEIDVVLIHPKGRGHQSHKERFYSPIRQNGAHIKHLKRILSQSVPMWSLIVFSDGCTRKEVTVSPDKQYKVVQFHQLKSLVSKVIKETPDDIFSTSDLNWMYEELYPFTQEDEETRQHYRSRDII
jgi:hypothetical protein